MIVGAVLVAAGRGVRLGAAEPKAFVSLAGRPLLARALDVFASHPRVGPLVLVVPDPARARAVLGRAAERARLVAGGRERQDSVRLGLEALPPADIVLIHDVARPLVPADVIDAVIDAAARHGAAVPAVPSPDTVKMVDDDGAVVATLPRERVRLAQTPQGFRDALIRSAHARAAASADRGTDDAALVERMGARGVVVEGSPFNLKITRPADLHLADVLVRLAEKSGGAG